MFSSDFGHFVVDKVPDIMLFHLAKSPGNRKNAKNEPDKNHNRC